MPVTVNVRADDAVVRSHREVTARRVVNYFGSCLPNSRVLCFLDDEDPPMLRLDLGVANRGFYAPIHDSTPLAGWPGHVVNCIYVDDNASLFFPRVVDDLVYLHGSTCIDEVSLTMTLAHELQHTIQHAQVRKLWAENSLIRSLDREVIEALKLTWADIPIEAEARIISKRVAESLFGEQRVRKHIDKRIAERITEDDVADWEYVRTLTPSDSVELLSGTQQLFERLKGYRSELEQILQQNSSSPDYADLDLGAYFPPAQ